MFCETEKNAVGTNCTFSVSGDVLSVINSHSSMSLGEQVQYKLVERFGTTAPPAPALSGELIMTINLNNNTYSSFGQPRTLSANTPKPFIDSRGNTLIPVRFMEEMKVADSINYNAATQTVIIKHKMNMLEHIEGWSIVMTIGSPTFYNDNGISEGREDFKDGAGNAVSPVIIDGRTYLPLRALLEQAFGFTVQYSSGVINVFGSR
jgi:hypothetical protein